MEINGKNIAQYPVTFGRSVEMFEFIASRALAQKVWRLRYFSVTGLQVLSATFCKQRRRDEGPQLCENTPH